MEYNLLFAAFVCPDTFLSVAALILSYMSQFNCLATVKELCFYFDTFRNTCHGRDWDMQAPSLLILQFLLRAEAVALLTHFHKPIKLALQGDQNGKR